MHLQYRASVHLKRGLRLCDLIHIAFFLAVFLLGGVGIPRWKAAPLDKGGIVLGALRGTWLYGKDVFCLNRLRKNDFLLLAVLTGIEFYKPCATGRAGEMVIVCLIPIKIGGIEKSSLQIMDIDFVNMSVFS